MPEAFAASREPTVGEVRYVLYRTLISAVDGGAYDPRFASFDLHPLPPGTTEDSAWELGTVLADEDAAYVVMLGKVEFVGSVDGVGKMRTDAAVKAAVAAGKK